MPADKSILPNIDWLEPSGFLSEDSVPNTPTQPEGFETWLQEVLIED
jgi:hypothetical protein